MVKTLKDAMVFLLIKFKINNNFAIDGKYDIKRVKL